MGFIADLDFPHVIPGSSPGGVRLRRTHSRAKRGERSEHPRGIDQGSTECRPTEIAAHGIANDTPLVPRAAAEAVWEEACLYLAEELPPAWIDRLTERADAIYEHAPRFRHRVRGSGDHGREWLWSFMRHWLAALIKEHRPKAFQKLPARYCVGQGW